MLDTEETRALLERIGRCAVSEAELRQLAGASDARVVALVARHPHLPDDVLARLIDHPDRAVRSAIAGRANLGASRVAVLARDPDRRVRRRTMRCQRLDVEGVLRAMGAGFWSAALRQELERCLAEPAVAERVLGMPRFAWLAVRGTFDSDTLHRVMASCPLELLRAIAGSAWLDDGGIAMLGRHEDRRVQEYVGWREDLTPRQARRLVARGDLWAVAACVTRHHTVRGVPMIARFRRDRVVERARAPIERRRSSRWFLSRTPHWDVAAALATNPRVSRRSQRRVSARHGWAISASLARRSDLRERRSPIVMVPAVQLVLAQNSAAPAGLLASVARSPDRYVRGYVLGNPNVPVELARAAIADPSTPAWAVARAAGHPGLTGDERDDALAWIALGGAQGDVNFDPVGCIGAPHVDRSADEGYWLEMQSDQTFSALWRARALTVRESRRVTMERLWGLARDDDPRVRRTAAAFLHRGLLAELAWDADVSVSDLARQTWRSPELPPAMPEFEQARKMPIGSRGWDSKRWGRVVASAVALAALFAVSSGYRRPENTVFPPTGSPGAYCRIGLIDVALTSNSVGDMSILTVEAPADAIVTVSVDGTDVAVAEDARQAVVSIGPSDTTLGLVGRDDLGVWSGYITLRTADDGTREMSCP